MSLGLLVVLAVVEATFVTGVLAKAALAALCGMRVERVAFGLGRPLWRGRLFEIRVFPLLGSARIAGLDPTDSPVAAGDPRAFGNRPLPLRLLVTLGWPIGAQLFTVALGFAVLLWGGGRFVEGRVVRNVLPDSPAAAAGIHPGDIVRDPAQLARAAAGRPVQLDVERGMLHKSYVIPPRDGRIGVVVVPLERPTELGPGAAAARAARDTLDVQRSVLRSAASGKRSDVLAIARFADDLDDLYHRLLYGAAVGAALVIWAFIPLPPFPAGRFFMVLVGWRGRRRRDLPEARDAGDVAATRGRFPLALAGVLGVCAVATLFYALAAVVRAPIYFTGAVLVAATAVALAGGRPRAWNVAFLGAFVFMPNALLLMPGYYGLAWLAAAALVPVVLARADVRRYFRQECPACKQLAARPVSGSPRASCLACGSSFRPV
jgi:hypothetical protein